MSKRAWAMHQSMLSREAVLSSSGFSASSCGRVEDSVDRGKASRKPLPKSGRQQISIRAGDALVMILTDSAMVPRSSSRVVIEKTAKLRLESS